MVALLQLRAIDAPSIDFPDGKARSLVIPAPLIKLLKEAWRKQKKDRETAGESWEEWDLYFPNSLGKPMEPRDDWAAWKWLCKAAGVRDARLHDARHTAATLLLEQGVDIRVVQEIKLSFKTWKLTGKFPYRCEALQGAVAQFIARGLAVVQAIFETFLSDDHFVYSALSVRFCEAGFRPAPLQPLPDTGGQTDTASGVPHLDSSESPRDLRA